MIAVTLLVYFILLVCILSCLMSTSFLLYIITGLRRKLWHDAAGIHLPDYQRPGLHLNGIDYYYYDCRCCGKCVTEYKSKYEIVDVKEKEDD